MKKIFMILLAITFSSIVYSQVGINTASPKSTLDITAKNSTGASTNVDGLLVPRLDRLRAQSMISVPLSTMIYVNDISTGAAAGIAANIDAVGYYYYNGTIWVKTETLTTLTNNNNGTFTYVSENGTGVSINAVVPKFFYMPSIVLPTNIADPAYNPSTGEFTLNLYQLYSSQFTAPVISSNAASTLPVLSSGDMDYFVTYSDASVFNIISLGTDGILKYKLQTGYVISEKTYMNVVLKVK
ncbi:hypothetical protein [Chryseobacterium polytrichastri]|uniref:Uncharacterized protein n=1 Tax=Chryseobacterium polytrichastri TaxID=1302687 RepID=A0A1M7E883_9FLAO|nr:hypothetical protein [Chryseobacterium polytrichastri]SHL87947.1 hypothetical protein SAMN05444267_102731 [Chryseobacterium polytrichastri]